MELTHKTTYLIDACYGVETWVNGKFVQVTSEVLGSWTIAHDGTVSGKMAQLVKMRETAAEVLKVKERIERNIYLTDSEKEFVSANCRWLMFSVIDKEELSYMTS